MLELLSRKPERITYLLIPFLHRFTSVIKWQAYHMVILILIVRKVLIRMSPLDKEQKLDMIEQEKNLCKQLDKGIDEMERGQVIFLNESIARIRAKLEIHEV